MPLYAELLGWVTMLYVLWTAWLVMRLVRPR